MEIKIDKGVPIPDPKSRGGKWSRVFRAMDIGDSFVVTEDMIAGHKTLNSAKSSLIHAARRDGMKITTRALEIVPGNNGIFRVWRIE